MGGVVAGGVQQYNWRTGTGRNVWVRYVREKWTRGAYAAARLLQLRCAEGHAVARVLPSGALVILDVHVR
jgi:hypothetical protein